MRIDAARSWIGIAGLLLTSLTAAEGVGEDIRYYDVAGGTVAEIWRDMRANGPTARDGKRYNATTTWTVRWRYPYARSAAGCATGPVTVKLSVVYRLPRWDSPRDASTTVEDQWERYIDALEDHERGHGDFGRQAAREIEAALEAIRPRPSCEALVETANETGTDILKMINAEEREYDRRTNHGATQGTAFFRALAEGKTTSRD